MGLIYLALYKGKGKLFNRLIRLWTRSKYSHCELVMPDGRWLSASAMDGGVRAKRIDLDLAHWDLIPLPWANAAHIEGLFQRHQGKGYDWVGILLSQVVPIAIQSPARMFCSEFCAAALGLQASASRFSPMLLGEVVQRINALPFVQLAHSVPQDARNEHA
ncbi:hypothetical protein IB229_13080 [Pseudomonas sp. PDM14]|uniref:hypothetical protein n=1 Tax=Pseudomonas sp. PDM14 TaxID=2769288 RepID=UPI00177ED838|nr:hypothetical protein [Pseudomonas sp. PDM14]MBD9483913.1 hypothetical protein [Pseudomonas sp. PDM14]